MQGFVRTNRATVAGLLVGLAAFLSPLAAAVVPPVVFVSRDLDTANTSAALGRTTAVQRAQSGVLVFLDAEKEVRRNLVDATAAGAPAWTPTDVLDPDVSFDGTRVVFSGLFPRRSVLAPIRDRHRRYGATKDHIQRPNDRSGRLRRGSTGVRGLR